MLGAQPSRMSYQQRLGVGWLACPYLFVSRPVVLASIEWRFTLVLAAVRSYGRVMHGIEERLGLGAIFSEFMGAVVSCGGMEVR